MHVPTILSFLITLLKYWMNDENYESLHYLIFRPLISLPLPLPLSPLGPYILLSTCSETPVIYIVAGLGTGDAVL
jgi:hypothetical protein